ncbi:LysR family transcriptional regulator [Paraglaciecola arctica]|uniref:LysR family transcriptional regulator n=1 Tax=Paraglaciecola arctica TaxID=1128911 RepID=UPI001C07C029|nr:LysR family transcriptional regulator [Paraglaciecola arctica]MBU3005903.1 LysR family transcriptional regulator [Paraglaciecola arctica]
MNQLEDMQTFVRIVEAGSITRASEQLNTVKSAISRRLAELEKRLGVTLLTRTTRSQTLTDSGLSYYQQCLRIIEDLAEVEASIKDKHCSFAGTIKISVPFSFGLKHLAPAFRQFNQAHPNVLFNVDFNDRKVDLIEEGYDLAIRISTLADSTLIARKITSVSPVLCASPAYLKQYGEPKTAEDLNQGHVRLRYNLMPEAWQLVSDSGKTVVVKSPVVVSANNGNYLCEEAIAGRGLMFGPDFICYEAIRAGQLKLLLCEQLRNQTTNAYAVYPHTRHLSQRVRGLVDFLADYFGEKPYWGIYS